MLIKLVVCLALLTCLVSLAAASDIGLCIDADGERETCSSTKDRDGNSYGTLCRESIERIDELQQLAQSDATAFVPQAWAWIEAAGKCVYAVDNHLVPASSSSLSSATLQSHIVTTLRTVLSLDKSPLTPTGACDKLAFTKKKKSLKKIFDATILGGGWHPDLKLKVNLYIILQCTLMLPSVHTCSCMFRSLRGMSPRTTA